MTSGNPYIVNNSFDVDGDTVILSMKEVIKNKHKTLNTSCQFFLACKVSFEISADSVMGTPL